MKISGERYFPQINNAVLGPYEPFISYEHWHRYCFATPFVSGKTVLDIACGEGYGSDYLAEYAALVYGVDVCHEAVQHARQTYVRNNLRFLQGSAAAIPIPGQHCLDIIVSFETIEHLDAATQEYFVREVRRLLKPEGLLLVSTPNRMVYSRGQESQNPYHLHEFNQEELVQFLGRHFAHIRLVSQRVYPTSYIWNLAAPSAARSEYQLLLDGVRFRPCQRDSKETTYLIAICTNGAVAPQADDSLLIDLSEVAFRGVPGREQWHNSTLYWDSGCGFRSEESVYEPVAYEPSFTVSYRLDPSVPCRRLRWDPVEARLCRVHLRRVFWQDDCGAHHELDLDQASSNGDRLAEGVFRFETGDPMVYLPITGPVAEVALEGDCMVEGEAASLQRLETLLAHYKDELRGMQELLQAREQCLVEHQQCLQECQQQLQESRQQLQEHQQRLQEYQSLRTLGPAFLRALLCAAHRRMPPWVCSVLSLPRQPQPRSTANTSWQQVRKAG